MNNIENQFSEFLIRNSNITINTISKHYGLTSSQLNLYSQILNWNLISENININWSEEIIEDFKEFLNWEILSLNPKLPWSFALIKKFEKNWVFGRLYHDKGLNSNSNIPWTIEILYEYKEVWNWSILSSSNYLPWDEKLIQKFKEKWSWYSLCKNESIPWQNNFIEIFYNYIEWEAICSNKSFPWTEILVEKYFEKIVWTSLANNKGFLWTEEFIIKIIDLKFENKEDLFLKELCENQHLPWTENLVEIFINKINKIKWGSNSIYSMRPDILTKALAMNNSLPLSIEFIKKHKSFWNKSNFTTISLSWVDYYDIFKENLQWKSLSKGIISLIYTEELIEEYKDIWDWTLDGMASNEFLPWTMNFVDKYSDKLEWRRKFTNYNIFDNNCIPWTTNSIEKHKKKVNFKTLSKNVKLDWNIEFIRKYKNKFDWSCAYNIGMSSNPSLPWNEEFVLEFEPLLEISSFSSSYNMISNRVIIPFILRTDINNILDNIKAKK